MENPRLVRHVLAEMDRWLSGAAQDRLPDRCVRRSRARRGRAGRRQDTGGQDAGACSVRLSARPVYGRPDAADIIGTSVVSLATDVSAHKGPPPIAAADEINRMPPRTQAARSSAWRSARSADGSASCRVIQRVRDPEWINSKAPIRRQPTRRFLIKIHGVSDPGRGAHPLARDGGFDARRLDRVDLIPVDRHSSRSVAANGAYREASLFAYIVQLVRKRAVAGHAVGARPRAAAFRCWSRRRWPPSTTVRTGAGRWAGGRRCRYCVIVWC